MLQKKIRIPNKLGLHARASMKLISLASRFHSEIIIRSSEIQADAKDILAVMSLGAPLGAEVELIISGPDETEAMEKISLLINDRFGEPE